jgi:hypothetical protein
MSWAELPGALNGSMMWRKCRRKDATRAMDGGLFERTRLLLTVLASLAGCASAPAPSPRDLADASDTGQLITGRTPAERAILAKLPTLPSGNPQSVGGTDIVAEPSYMAASGRPCRAVHMGRAGTQPVHRVACGGRDGWAFVPDVFGSANGAQSE